MSLMWQNTKTADELVADLEFGTDDVREHVAATIMDLCYDQQNSKEIGRHPGCIKALVDILKGRHGDDCKQYAAGAMATLAYFGPNAADIVKRGGHEALVELLRNRGTDGRKQYAAWALGSLASLIPEQRAACVTAGAVGALVDLIQARDDHVTDGGARRAACQALWNLCGDKEGRDKVVAAGAIEPLTKLAWTSGDRDATEYAKIALEAVGFQDPKVKEQVAEAKRKLLGDKADTMVDEDPYNEPY